MVFGAIKILVDDAGEEHRGHKVTIAAVVCESMQDLGRIRSCHRVVAVESVMWNVHQLNKFRTKLLETLVLSVGTDGSHCTDV